MQANTQIQPKVYKTADLYYAAYLSVAGVEIDSMDKHEKERRVYFTFVDEGQLDDLRKGYYRSGAKIPALRFTQEIKNLKNQTIEIMRGG